MEITLRLDSGELEKVRILDYVPGSVRSKVAPLYAKLGSVDMKDEGALVARMFSHPIAQEMLEGLTEEQLADKDLMTKQGAKLFKNRKILSDLFISIGDDEDSVNAAYEIAQNIIIRKGVSEEALAIISDLEAFKDQDSTEVYECVKYFRQLLLTGKSGNS